jgi:DNA (cytosine-5)-methyltransferase 1
MKYLSVCSGIEAATVAWHGLGWTPVAFAEIEAFPAAVLSHHYPTVPNLGDLTKYREWPEEILAEVDLLVGGTPCQAFSVAGLRRSLDDERGNLSLTYVNLFHHINEVRKRHGRSPAIALWENVPGVLSTKDNAFGCFIGGLLRCDEAPQTESGKWDKAGFLSSETVRVGYRVLDAQYFGVAQRRRRVFLAAVPRELVERFGERACPSEILSLRESVLGNPPSRGAAWQGAARDTTACSASSSGCGEPFYLDRASFNQGENAQYEPQITNDGVAGSAVARGPAAVAVDTYNQTISDTSIPVRVGNAKDSLPAVLCQRVSGTLNGNGKAAGSATQQDAETGMLVAFGGNRTSGPLDVATSVLAHAGPHGRQDFASETFVFTGDGVIADPIGASEARTYTHEGTTFRLHNCVGICATGEKTHALTTRRAAEEDGTGRGTPIVPAVAVRTANTGANGHGVSDEVTHTIDQAQGQAIAFKPGQSEAAGGTFVTEEFAPTMQSQNNGSTAVPAVAFKPSHFTRGKDGAPSEVVAPLSADADKGDQDTVVALPIDMRQASRGDKVTNNRLQGSGGPPGHGIGDYGDPAFTVSERGQSVAFTKAKRAQSDQDDESWVPGDVAPTQNQFDVGDTRATTVVAFTQNSRDEVRQISGDGQLAGSLSAEAGMHQTNYIAFANRTRDGVKVPEVMKDGVTPALMNPGQGGRADAVNVMAPGPVSFNAYQRTEGEATWPIGASDGRKVEVGVRSGMLVRRLTPTECEALQGFPSGYTDVTFRKKPAADGPRYRALGNSMAVPCMWWLGDRIHKATTKDIA